MRAAGRRPTVIRRLLGSGEWRRARAGRLPRPRLRAARGCRTRRRPSTPVRGAGGRARRRGGGLAHHGGPAARTCRCRRARRVEVVLTRRPPARSNRSARDGQVHVAEFADAERGERARRSGARRRPPGAGLLLGARPAATPWPSPTPRSAGTWSRRPSCRPQLRRRRRRPGAGSRRAWSQRADPLAENWLESVSRWWLAEAGLPRPVLQQRFTDEFGVVRARVDFWLPEHADRRRGRRRAEVPPTRRRCTPRSGGRTGCVSTTGSRSCAG